MAVSFRRRVAFSETDASGRVHFTSLLKWVEDSEHELLESLGVLICSEKEGWPRARVECDYRQPFLAGEQAEIEIQLGKVGASSLHWGFRILKENGTIAAEGKMVTVLVGQDGPREIDEAARAKLQGQADQNPG